MYNTNKINTILFDMDGTVLASEDIFGKAELMLLHSYGIDADAKSLREFQGTSVDEFYPRFISKFSLTDNRKIIEKKLRAILFDCFKTDLEYIPGFINFYNSIISPYNIKIALVTNTSLDLVNHIRQSINLDDYFSLFITATDVSDPKPSGVPYLQAIEKLNSNIENTIVIEDSKTGILSGLNAGCQVFALTTTLSYSEISSINSEIKIFDSYSDINKYLDGKV